MNDAVPTSKAGNDWASVEVVVAHGVGIHARPAVTFTQLARSFPCVIEMEVDDSGLLLNAKSIVKVLGARVRNGSRLKLSARGARAADAVYALKALVEDDFGEDGPDAERG